MGLCSITMHEFDTNAIVRIVLNTGTEEAFITVRPAVVDEMDSSIVATVEGIMKGEIVTAGRARCSKEVQVLVVCFWTLKSTPKGTNEAFSNAPSGVFARGRL